ncbi:uncharacterized protein TRIADDRAFT_51481 [Trichoplax adhaerens]|uniref:Myotubularin-related protein 13 n=1 Tax=Trichoplax adhaerens TaxID=10228 RepID=B3RJB7_TRIAD|nr:hypothetical protein TRIADDRAFT_51481 [Trichoplax adhaerens]EDV28505.1 hypothetical protein TRIADDRAFT_51481 [Trichoplax adhaerens]|eukprot:XP_002107707.1 hypothetical protein TRIADDRAFT_51481 [Trichoplax adhaerens]
MYYNSLNVFPLLGIDRIFRLAALEGKTQLIGKVLQRFPEQDRRDAAFPSGIEMFCLPTGWKCINDAVPPDPTFYVVTLTNMEGDRFYCASLAFYELRDTITTKTHEHHPSISEGVERQSVSSQPSSTDLSKPSSSEMDIRGSIILDTASLSETIGNIYLPKAICIVSRLALFESFRHCLCTLYYAVYNGQTYLLEELVPRILSDMYLPPAGYDKVAFKLDEGNVITLQAAREESLPITGSAISSFFKHFGIQNSLTLFCAILTESRILFTSSSFSTLSLICHGLLALIFPVQFSHVFIPILPTNLLDILDSPTPFVIGVSSSCREKLDRMNESSEVLEEIVLANIDGGNVIVPERIQLPPLPRIFHDKVSRALNAVVNTHLVTADLAFQPVDVKPSPPTVQDKELRAIFLRLFAEIFSGYRTCLTLTRILSKPIIFFDQEKFLQQRGLKGEPFMEKLLANIDTIIENEGDDHVKFMENVHNLAAKLQDNEPVISHTPKFTDQSLQQCNGGIENNNLGNFNGTMQTFPLLTSETVESAIAISKTVIPQRPNKATIVPGSMGVHTGRKGMKLTGALMLKRLEVLRKCVSNIFNNRIIEAKKMFSAVLSLLTSVQYRIALVEEFESYCLHSRVVLTFDQFDMVVRLINQALQEDDANDRNGVAAMILPFSASFCRKLSDNVHQFAYTCVWDHPVWDNPRFWERTFYLTCQKHVMNLYENSLIKKANKNAIEAKNDNKVEDVTAVETVETAINTDTENGKPKAETTFGTTLVPSTSTSSINGADSRTDISSPKLTNSNTNLLNAPNTPSVTSLISSTTGSSNDEYHPEIEDLDPNVPVIIGETMAGKMPMDIAAEQLKKWEVYDNTEKEKLTGQEQSTIYTQAINYVYRLIFLRLTMDLVSVPTTNSRSARNLKADAAQASLYSFTANEGQDDDGLVGTAKLLLKDLSHFIDRVCVESGLSSDHIRTVQTLIPSERIIEDPVFAKWENKLLNVTNNSKHFLDLGTIKNHLEELRLVKAETEKLPQRRKVKIVEPPLLPNESIITPASEGTTYLRAYLLPDGREPGLGGLPGTFGPNLFPAEGAVFLTSYRIVFKGFPLDPTVSEMHVCRSFPIGSLTKEKKLPATFLEVINAHLTECLQLRSSTFELMKLAFDDEVGSERVEAFKKQLLKLRSPHSVLSTFAYEGAPIIEEKVIYMPSNEATAPHVSQKLKDKTSAFKDITTNRMRHALHHGVKFLGRRSGNTGSINNDSEGSSIGKKVAVVSTAAMAMVGGEERSSSAHSMIEDATDNLPAHTYKRPIEELVKLPYVSDYERLHLGSLVKFNLKSPGHWRMTTINEDYSICKSYPAVVVVPHGFKDESIALLAKNHKQNRFPVVTWIHPQTKAVLLRSGTINRASLSSLFKLTTSGGSEGNAGVSSGTTADNEAEEEKYLTAIITGTPRIPKLKTGKSPNPAKRRNSSSSPRNSRNARIGRTASRKVTQIQSQTIKRLTTPNSSPHRDPVSENNDGYLNNTMYADSLIDKRLAGKDWEAAHLYVLGDKSAIKQVKNEQNSKCEFIPVEYPESRSVRSSFKKLLRCCCPSNAENGQSFYKAVEESEWLNQVQCLMQVSGAIVDLIDIQGSSVLLALEDGWDATSQIISLSQLCMDPTYRTLDGFRTLIEKDWLAFGHQFSTRNCMLGSTQSTNFTPVFLQFLDAVHQIMLQYPQSFEFNLFFLETIAYHCCSSRFVTFMFDCERDRHYLEKSVLANESESFEKCLSPLKNTIWNYIDDVHRNSTQFYNFNYSVHKMTQILRPVASLTNLKVWDYYIKRNLYIGSPYDIELLIVAKQLEDDQIASERSNLSKRSADSCRVISGCFGSLTHLMRSRRALLFDDYLKLRSVSNTSIDPWGKVWTTILHSIPKESEYVKYRAIQEAKAYSFLLHKRTSGEIILKGKMIGSAATSFTHPHNFEVHNFLAPLYCDYCMQILWGLVKQGMKCSDCGYNCHEKCAPLVPWQCSKIKGLKLEGPSPMDNTIADSKTDGKWLENTLHKRGTGAPKKQDEDCFFEIITERRVFHLMADDREIAKKWLDGIQECIDNQ